MLITIRKFDPSSDTGLLEFQDDRTIIHTGSTGTSTPFVQPDFQKKFSPDGIWVAHDGIAVVGAIVFGRSEKGTSACTAIHGVAVHTPYQRRGIGGTLMYKAELFAKSNGIDRMILRTDPDNEGALILFKKCWYSVIDTSEDIVTMEKILKHRR